MTEMKPMELGELAEYGRLSSFDATQPLRRYLGAIRQMMREAKVYQSEGDYDKAFVYSLKILTLSTDLLPNRHPEWENSPTSIKAQVYRDSELVQANLSELREAIYSRNLAWSITHPPISNVQSTTTALSDLNISTPSRSNTPILTLKESVQPATMSMSSTSQTSASAGTSKLVKAKPAEGRAKKWSSKFGLGKKRVDSDDEKKVDGESVETKSTLRRAKTEMINSGARHARKESLVKEGEYSSDLSSTETDNRINKEQLYNGVPPTQYNYPPNFPHTIPPPPPLPSQHQQVQPIHYHKPQAYASTSNHSFESPGSSIDRQQYQSQPPSQQQSQQSLRPNPLQRTPSRLTTSHQQQQGYSPSPSPLLSTSSFSPSAQIPIQPQVQLPLPTSNYPPPPPPIIPRNLITPPTYYQQQPVTSQQSYTPTQAPFLPPPPPLPIPHTIPRPLQQQQLNISQPAPNRQLSTSSSSTVSSFQSTISPRLARTNSLAALPLGVMRRSISGERISSSNVSNYRDEQKDRRGVEYEDIKEEEEEEDLCKTEGGYPLRNVIVPSDLISQFVALAIQNTDKGIETCGLLMGKLAKNTFTITNLLIPKQVGTQDTCSTTHEEEQFQYQDERDLMTLGWIHTHPTQTCFMSSLDLHTHASYQIMLAEAIAIVCSPNQDISFGIFRLTDPPGLETIMKCSNKGLFHPHPDLPIYTNCDHGHVQMRNNQKFEFDDFRFRRRIGFSSLV